MGNQLKVSEAALQLGVSRYTVYAWVAARRIRHTRYGRTLRIPAAEVKRIIREGTVRATSADGGIEQSRNESG